MATSKDDTPKGGRQRPDRGDGQPLAHERQQAQGYRSERNPRNDRGQGDERKQQQGRGNDPDRH